MPTPTPPVPSILIVDDDPNVRLIAAKTLAGWGFRIREAETAEEAFAALMSEPDRPQLLLIDVVLPGADGVTLAGQVRAAGVRSVSGVPSSTACTGTLQRASVRAAGMSAGLRRRT